MTLAGAMPGNLWVSWVDGPKPRGSADGLERRWEASGPPECLSISRVGVSQFTGWHSHQPTPHTHPTSWTTPPTCQPDPLGWAHGRTQLACRLPSQPPPPGCSSSRCAKSPPSTLGSAMGFLTNRSQESFLEAWKGEREAYGQDSLPGGDLAHNCRK